MHLPQGGIMSFHKEKADERRTIERDMQEATIQAENACGENFYTVVQFANFKKTTDTRIFKVTCKVSLTI